MGCIVIMPYFPGAEQAYEDLPVAFLSAPEPPAEHPDATTDNRRSSASSSSPSSASASLLSSSHDDAAPPSLDGPHRAWGQPGSRTPPSLGAVTPAFLRAVEAKHGALASDAAEVRRRLSPAFWAAKFRAKLVADAG